MTKTSAWLLLWIVPAVGFVLHSHQDVTKAKEVDATQQAAHDVVHAAFKVARTNAIASVTKRVAERRSREVSVTLIGAGLALLIFLWLATASDLKHIGPALIGTLFIVGLLQFYLIALRPQVLEAQMHVRPSVALLEAGERVSLRIVHQDAGVTERLRSLSPPSEPLTAEQCTREIYDHFDDGTTEQAPYLRTSSKLIHHCVLVLPFLRERLPRALFWLFAVIVILTHFFVPFSAFRSARSGVNLASAAARVWCVAKGLLLIAALPLATLALGSTTIFIQERVVDLAVDRTELGSLLMYQSGAGLWLVAAWIPVALASLATLAAPTVFVTLVVSGLLRHSHGPVLRRAATRLVALVVLQVIFATMLFIANWLAEHVCEFGHPALQLLVVVATVVGLGWPWFGVLWRGRFGTPNDVPEPPSQPVMPAAG